MARFDAMEKFEEQRRQELRRMNMLELLAKLAEARKWWEEHRGEIGCYDMTPLIEEEIRTRV